MNENSAIQEKQCENADMKAPVQSDNASENEQIHKNEVVDSKLFEGQSEKSDPKENLILGKFKTVDDLSKAYVELQKHQGKSSEELGTLRKELSNFEELKNATNYVQAYQESIIPVIRRDKELYPEYFENSVFKEMYSEALMAHGDNLDTDRMINLLETYVQERIKAYDKQKTAEVENQQILDNMSYSKNPKNSISDPKKSLNEMSEDEFRESIRKLI